MLYIVLNWFWWHVPQLAGSMIVFGRADGLPTCSSMPVWQLVHASPLCLPASWNSLTGAWQPKQPLASKLACFLAGVAALRGCSRLCGGCRLRVRERHRESEQRGNAHGSAEHPLQH